MYVEEFFQKPRHFSAKIHRKTQTFREIMFPDGNQSIDTFLEESECMLEGINDSKIQTELIHGYEQVGAACFIYM